MYIVVDLRRNMDNPDYSGHLRRHNSVPSKCRLKSSFISSQLRLKSNPYIGCFRHSPPTCILSVLVSYCELPSENRGFLLKTSPFPSSFRHTPTFSVLEQADDERRLPGGSPTADSASIENKLLESKFFDQGTGYSTLKVLAKLSRWLSIPFQFAFVDEERKSVSDDQIDGNRSSCDDYCRGYYNDVLSLSTLASCDGEAHDILPHHTRPLEASLSHVAEAYYAHQATQHVDEFSSNEQHFDYVVTQFDIARMARNASKHLDVESILSLPTLMYHSSTSKDCRDGDGINESWSLVTAPNMDRPTEEVAMESNICVICMEEYVEGERLRVLPCNHSFHVGCIDRWLSGSHSHLDCVTNGCPVCKEKPVPMMEPAVECDGSVPSWAFTQLGDALARSLGVP